MLIAYSLPIVHSQHRIPDKCSNDKSHKFAQKETYHGLRYRGTHKTQSQRYPVADEGYEAEKSHKCSLVVEPLLCFLYLFAFDSEIFFDPLYFAQIAEIVRGKSSSKIAQSSRHDTQDRVHSRRQTAPKGKLRREGKNGSCQKRHQKQPIITIIKQKL